MIEFTEERSEIRLGIPDVVSPYKTGDEIILVVEDDDLVRRAITRSLRRRGYFVLDAANGCEAHEKCHSTQDIALVIVDMVMPDCNGTHLLHELRSIQPQIKVLFMSGYPLEMILERGMSLLNEEFVGKPQIMDNLDCKVREILDR
jgi:two-component system cell cycle sensor histidine kinase/response regulator CckA